MPWYDEYDDDKYEKSVNGLKNRGYRFYPGGATFDPPKDKPWMSGGWVDEDGNVHKDM